MRHKRRGTGCRDGILIVHGGPTARARAFSPPGALLNLLGHKMWTVLRTVLPAIALFVASNALALPSYKDANIGVVPQDNGRVCIVVLNSSDRTHAFHFVVDGEKKVVTVGILDRFLPNRSSATSMVINIDLGPLFARRFVFKRHSDGMLSYLGAELSADDVKSTLAALQSDLPGVTITFDNGETWRIPPPKQAAASAVTQCWNEALA